MKITFVCHSCFLVELETCSLLFDWYGSELPELDRSKPLYVLNSHHHGDHYSPDIFSLGMEKTWYILGSCIRLSAKRKQELGIDEEHLYRLGGGKTLTLNGLQIQTLHSTDAGVAFLVEVEGKRLYHAGDLQWWYWREGTEAQNREMERNFKREVDQLAAAPIDVAFLVLDPRLEEGTFWGFDWIMRHTDIRRAFPMHSWEEFWVTKKLLQDPCSQEYREKVVPVLYNGQVFSPDAASRETDGETGVLEVVAALIRKGERILVCQRPAHKARGLLWEFPGGKVEAGESKPEALVRECREELGVTLRVAEPFTALTHTYPDLTIHLTVFWADLTQDEPQKLEHQALRWATMQEMETLSFSEADQTIVARLRERK